MSKNLVPVQPSARNLSTLAILPEVKSVESAMISFARLERKMPDRAVYCKAAEQSFYNPPLNPDFDLAGARHALDQARQACALVPGVLRSAEPDEIATQLSLLQANDIHKDHRDQRQQQIAMPMWCESIANRRPSIYALQTAFVHLREDYTFHVALAEILNEVEKAKERAKRLKTLETRLSRLQKEVDDFERDLPDLIEEHAARRKVQVAEEERQRQVLVQRAKDFPPETCGGLYTSTDLRLLGLTQDELERRREARRAARKRSAPLKTSAKRRARMRMPRGWKVDGGRS